MRVHIRDDTVARLSHARIQKIFSGGGGGGGQIPRRGLTENFNMAKIHNLAIPGGGGVRTPCPPPFRIRPCIIYTTSLHAHRHRLVAWGHMTKQFLSLFPFRHKMLHVLIDRKDTCAHTFLFPSNFSSHLN